MAYEGGCVKHITGILGKLRKATFLARNHALAPYHIGEWTYGKPQVHSWGEGATLRIGRFCAIGEGVQILLGGEHRTDWITTYPFNVVFAEASSFTGHPATKGSVVIGNDVWIGADAFILSGVNIGDGAVIGARSVVTGDVKPYEIVAGNPAKHVRFRFSQRQIEELLRIAWWDWTLPQIKQAWPLLMSADINTFLDQYGGYAPALPNEYTEGESVQGTLTGESRNQ